MKDLVFLLITLGLITFGMMFTQQRFQKGEAEKTKSWEKSRYNREFPSTPSPSPSASAIEKR